MKVILSTTLVFFYLLKYVTKQEHPSKHLIDVVKAASNSNATSAFGVAVKMVYGVMSKRNFSTHELHMLIDENRLVSTDINFVWLTLGDEVTKFRNEISKTFFQKYLRRTEDKTYKNAKFDCIVKIISKSTENESESPQSFIKVKKTIK